LHEEFHALYNEDEDEPAVAPADDDDVATNGSDGDVSDPDDVPKE
jgi:hypothetical protein